MSLLARLLGRSVSVCGPQRFHSGHASESENGANEKDWIAVSVDHGCKSTDRLKEQCEDSAISAEERTLCAHSAASQWHANCGYEPQVDEYHYWEMQFSGKEMEIILGVFVG